MIARLFFRVAAVAALSLSSLDSASAFQAGVTTGSFGALGCNECHTGGGDPLVEVVGPQFVRPLSTHEYTVRISATDTQPSGGFNLVATQGAVTLGGANSDRTQLMMGELTHSFTKESKRGFVNFSFLWTAPMSFTTANFDAWGNSVNGNGGTAGDKAASASFTVSNGELGLCPLVPDSCLVATKTSFALTDAADEAKDALAFAWSKGVSVPSMNFADPSVNADYALCLYVDGALVGEVDVPAATTCGDVPCWKVKGDLLDPSAYQYKNKVGAPSGVRTMKLTPSAEGKAKIGLKAKGVDLPEFGILPLGAATLAVQLRNSATGACFGDTYSGAEITKDDGVKFKAKAVNP